MHTPCTLLCSALPAGYTGTSKPLDTTATRISVVERWQAIALANPAKDSRISKKDWRNPYLAAHADGVAPIDLLQRRAHLETRRSARCAREASCLCRPYGRVAAVRGNGVRSGPQEGVAIRRNRAILAGTPESIACANQLVAPA